MDSIPSPSVSIDNGDEANAGQAKPMQRTVLLDEKTQLAISSTNLIAILWDVSSFSAVKAKSLLPTLIAREVKESLVVNVV